jgi:hypothetical protein
MCKFMSAAVWIMHGATVWLGRGPVCWCWLGLISCMGIHFESAAALWVRVCIECPCGLKSFCMFVSGVQAGEAWQSLDRSQVELVANQLAAEMASLKSLLADMEPPAGMGAAPKRRGWW